MLCGPDASTWTAAVAEGDDCWRGVKERGGVPKRGGEVPIELDSAAANAEMPGPEAENGAAPASGVKLPWRPAAWLGVGICLTGGYQRFGGKPRGRLVEL